MSDPKKRTGCFLVAVCVLLAASVLANFIFAGVLGARGARGISASHILADKAPEFDEQMIESGSDGGGSEKIVQIPLRGLISSSLSGDLGETMVDDAKIALRQAADDKNVKAIVLYVDSPGGEVTASDIIYDAVKKAREKKPVVVYMGSLAASGGYYVSCAGNFLMANETTITGSIGVIIQTLNYQGLLGKVGLDSVVFKSGKFKDILNGARPMTDEEKAFIQNMVMQTYDKFFSIVASERPIPAEQLREIADGRIISGKDAAQLKLINATGQIEDAYAKARELGHAPGAAVVRYAAGFRLGKLFRLFGKSDASGKVEVSLAPHVPALQLESGRLYLLPGFYAP